MASRTLTVLAAIVFAVVTLSGVSKLADLSEFRHALRAWSLLPEWSHGLLVPGVPTIELVCGLAWFAGWRPRTVTVSTLTMLAVFTGALSLEHLFGKAEGCACFGVVSKAAGLSDGLVYAVVRNLALCSVLAAWLARTRAPMPQAPHQTRTHPAAGFTLVELLVCIVVIGILAALSLTLLASVRQRSRTGVVLSTLRQHAGVISAYSNDYRDSFPSFTRPVPEVTFIAVAACQSPVESLYFDAYRTWPAALADGYYGGVYQGGPFRSPLWRAPVAGELAGWATDYFLPCVFLAAPEYWSAETRQVAPVQFMATRLAMVTVPVRKAVMVHDLGTTQRALAAASVDGHADEYGDGEIEPELIDDGHNGHQYGGHYGLGARMLHTSGGVRGFDVRR